MLNEKDKQVLILEKCFNTLKDGGLLILDVFKPVKYVNKKKEYNEVTRFRTPDNSIYIVKTRHTIDTEKQLHTFHFIYCKRKDNNTYEDMASIDITYRYIFQSELFIMLENAGFTDICMTDIYNGNTLFVSAKKRDVGGKSL